MTMNISYTILTHQNQKPERLHKNCYNLDYSVIFMYKYIVYIQNIILKIVYEFIILL